MPYSDVFKQPAAQPSGGGWQGGGFGNAAQGGGGSGWQGGGWQGGGTDWGRFAQLQQQLQQANAQINLNNPYQQQQGGWQGNPYQQQNTNIFAQDNQDEDRRFRMDGGTESLYNGRYRDANLADTLAIEAGKAGEWWNNLPGQIAGALGGEQAKQDWTFDMSKFDLTNGIGLDDATQVRNFAASLPGMMIGGLFEGAEKGYEAASGTPVQEYREKQGGGYEVADYQLDASQRAAAGVDAAINIGGTFLGGSGRIAGKIAQGAAKGAGKAFESGAKAGAEEAIEKAAKWQRRADNLEGMSQGWISRIATEDGKKKLGAVGQIAADMGEEASEEFVQSYADDIRMKNLDENSLDRALTGAAWGAVGGAMMGAPVSIANAISGPKHNSVVDPVGQSTADAFTYNDDTWGQMQKQGAMGSHLSAENKKYIEDAYAETRRIDGSGVSKMVLGDPDIMVDQTDLSDEWARSVFMKNDASAKIFADELGTTVDYLESAIINPSSIGFSTTADALNDLLDKKSGSMFVALGRTPATEKGAFRAEVRRFTHGSGSSVHPAVFGLVGGDVDGDTDGIYLQPDRFDVVGFPSEMVGMPEGGAGFNFWYTAISDGYKDDPNELRKILSPILDPYNRTMELDGRNVTLTQYYVNRFLEAFSQENEDQKQAMLAQTFMQLRRDIDQSKDMLMQSDPSASRLIGGRRAVNLVFHNLSNSASNTFYKLQQVRNREFETSIRTAFEHVNRKLLDEKKEPIPEDTINALVKHGTLGDASKHIEIYDHLGLVLSAVGYKGNIPFRQYGQVYYPSHAIKSDFKDIVESARAFVSDTSIFDAFIRAEFGMSAGGVSPTTAIEGTLDAFTLMKALQDSGVMSKKISTKAQLEAFFQSFIDAYNEYVDIYNEAKKRETSAGREWPVETVERVHIKDTSDPRFIDTFNRIFEFTPMSEVFDGNFLNENIKSMTWGEFVDSLYKRKGTFDQVFHAFPDPEFQEFINNVGKNYGHLKRAAEQRLYNDIVHMNTAPIVEQLERAKEEGRPGDYGNTLNSALDMMSMYGCIFGPENSFRGGALDPTQAYDNRVVRMLYSQDAEERLTAVVAYNWRTTFAHIIDGMKSDDADVRKGAENLLADASQMSTTHAVIAMEILETGDSEILSTLCDLNTTYKEKQQWFDQTIGAIDGDASLLIDSMITENSEFDLSSVTERIRKAENYAVKAERDLYNEARASISAVKTMLQNNQATSDEYKQYVEQSARLSNTMLDMNVLGAQVYEAAVIAHANVEKGTNNAAAGLNIAQLEAIINGGLVSYQELLWGLRQGRVSMATFQSNRLLQVRCITDPTFEIEVEDYITGKTRTMNQQVLFAEYGMPLNGKAPTGIQYLNLFEKCPQLADWLSGFQPKPGINADSKNPIVSPAKSISHNDGFVSFLKPYRNLKTVKGKDGKSIDTAVVQQVNDGLNALSIRLMNDPKYKSYLVGCLANDLEQGIDAPTLMRKAANMHEHIVRSIYSEALNAKGGTASVKGRVNWLNAVRRKSDADLVNSLSFASDMAEFALSERRAGENLSKIAEQQNVDNVFLFVVNEMANATFGDKADETSVKDFIESSNQFIAEQSRIANEKRHNFNEKMRQCRDIFSAMFGSTGNLLPFDVSRDARDRAYNALVRMAEESRGRTLTNDELQGMRNALDTIAETIKTERDSTGPSADLLIDLDKDFSDAKSLYEKLAKLYKEVGEPIPDVKPADPSFANASVEDRFKRKLEEDYFSGKSKDRKELQKLWANKVIKNILNDVEMAFDTDLNPDMFAFESDTRDFINGILDGPESAQAFLNEEGLLPDAEIDLVNRILQENGDVTMPVPKTSSKIAQGIATNLRIADDSGGAALYVRNNGGQVKQHYGYGHLGDENGYSYSTAAPVSGMTADRLLKMVDDDPSILRHKMVVEGKYNPSDPSAYKVDTVGSYIDTLKAMISAADVPGDIAVEYFDPIDNPHGLSFAHTPAPINEQFQPWYRLSGLIGRIDATAMEAMVMKAKKSFGAKDKVVEKNGGRWWNNADYTAKLETFSNPAAWQPNAVDGGSEAGMAMYDMLHAFRSDFANVFKKELSSNGPLSSLGWDEEQAILLATNLNPGLKITVKLEDGTVVKKVVDASLIVQKNFAPQFMDLVGTSDLSTIEVLDLEPFVVSPNTVSYRAMNAIATEKCEDQQSASAVATRVIEDWSDYEFDTLSVRRIMNGVSPLGYASRRGTPVRLSDSATAPQVVLDTITDGALGASNINLAGNRFHPKHIDIKSSRWAEARKAAKTLGISDAIPGVVRVFTPDTDYASIDKSLSAGELDFINKTLMHLDRPEDSYYAGGQTNNSAGLMLDPASLQDAIDWAANTCNNLIVPRYIIEQYGNGMLSRIDNVGTVDVKLGRSTVECFILSPSKSQFFRTLARDNAQSYRRPRRTKARVLVDRLNIFKNADASVGLTKAGAKLTIAPDGFLNLKIHRLFEKSKGTKDIASISSVVDLANQIVDDNGKMIDDSPAWNNIDLSYYKESKRKAKYAVYEYLLWAKNSDTKNPIRTDSMGSERCMALMSADDGVFAPVITPKTTASRYGYTDLQIIGDDIWIPWDSSMTIGESLDDNGNKLTEFIKVSASNNEAFKGEAVVLKLPDGLEDPSIGFLIGEDQEESPIHAIISEETESGRSVGRETFFMREALYNANAEMRGSLIFQPSENGGYELNPYLKDCIENPSQHPESPWTVGDLIDFLTGNSRGDDVITKVENGQLRLTDDDAANDVIRLVVARCGRYGVDPIHMLTTYHGTPTIAEDGSVVVPNDTIRFDNDEVNFNMALYGLNPDQLLRFYHGMNDNFCPNGANQEEIEGEAEKTLFDQYGNTLVTYKFNGELVTGYEPVRWTQLDALNESSFTSGHSGQASWAWQQNYMRAYELGFNDKHFNDTIAYQNFLLRDNGYMQEFAAKRAEERAKQRTNRMDNDDNLAKIIKDNPVISFAEAQHRQAVIRMRETHLRNRTITDEDGNIINNPESDQRIANQMAEFRKLFGPGCTYSIVEMWCKNKTGYTYNEGRGNHAISAKEMADEMAMVLKDFKEKGIPVTCYPGGKSFNKDRYALPHQVQWQIDWAWEHQTGFLEAKWGKGEAGKKKYIDAIKKEEKQAEEALGGMPPSERAKQQRLAQYIEWVYMERGEKLNNTLYLYNGQYVFDCIANDREIIPALAKAEGWTQEQVDVINDLIDRERGQLLRMRNIAEDKDMSKTARVIKTPGGTIVNPKYRDAWTAHRFLDKATKWSQAMGLGLNPFVTAANLIDRGASQGLMTAMINGVGKWNIGPWKYSDKKHIPNPDIIEVAVNDPTFMKLFKEYRRAGFTGEEIMFLSQLSEEKDIDEFIKNRQNQRSGSVFDGITEKLFSFGTGGDIGLKNQAKIFLNRFAMFADANPEQQFWFADTGDGMNTYEAQLASNPAKWFMTMLGSGDNTPSLTITRQALNSAKKGDLAQQHTMATLLGEIMRHMPMSKFLVITTMSKFPQYSFNIAHRTLNWIMPVSSLYYVFTEKAANTNIGQKLDLQTNQVHRNLKEALYCDMLHLGASAVALLLMGTAMLEPPDDERRWNNVDEWLFFGLRVGEAWWIKDILGMALPIAAFGKSASLGKPMLPLLTDGVIGACYSNPMMRINDAVGLMLDPEDSLFAEFDKAQEQYADAPNGAPDFLENMGLTVGMSSVSWLTQFFTPSVVSEIYKNWRAMTPELSYKRVYKRDATGKVLEDETYTQKTSYADAMWRKTARRNPWLFMIVDSMDPYPNTVYYDDYELNAIKATSIVGLDDHQAEIKVFSIIDTLMRYDNMEDLKATGFYLDAETKAAVSSQIWDNYYELKSEWNRLNQSGELDRYALGNGSWDAGNAAYYEIKEAFEQMEQYWSNFYYDKIKNSYLSEGMQQYNRYGTTYARDVYGNVYATGYHNAGVLPFISAPGSVNDPANTAGYGNDFASVSAVTGLPMYTNEGGSQRALVPVNPDRDEWPDFESWSDDGNGSSYSTMYANKYGNNGSSNSYNGKNTYPKSGGSGYTRRPYGGGGGYRRRGGGGGYSRGGSGGYAPNIYAPSVSLSNRTPSRIMNADRIQEPNFDYLRPDFETKGSREAYKRSDI